jgi:hypothetical protein
MCFFGENLGKMHNPRYQSIKFREVYLRLVFLALDTWPLQELVPYRFFSRLILKESTYKFSKLGVRDPLKEMLRCFSDRYDSCLEDSKRTWPLPWNPQWTLYRSRWFQFKSQDKFQYTLQARTECVNQESVFVAKNRVTISWTIFSWHETIHETVKV